jgi:ethanolamine utilization protein EutN
MIIGKIIGEVVSSAKHEKHEGIKLLLVRQLDLKDQDQGAPFIAVDVLGAGVGDKVLMTQDGWAAMTAVKRMKSPIDAAVIGIIDEVELLPEFSRAG